MRAAEFRVSAELNPRVKRAVYHASLSLPHEEHLTDARWRALADDYRKGMGFTDCQYTVYRHSSREHDHVHIVASRVGIIDGKTVSDSWDYAKSETLIRELEKKYSLASVRPSRELDTRSPTTGEQRRFMRTGEVALRVQLQELISSLTEDNPTMPQLIDRLKDRGVDVKVRFSDTGRIREGISYELNGIPFSGTSLGAAYTFKGLQKHRGVIYERSRHYEETCAAADREPRGEQVVDSRDVEGIIHSIKTLDGKDSNIGDGADFDYSATIQHESNAKGSNSASDYINSGAAENQQRYPESTEISAPGVPQAPDINLQGDASDVRNSGNIQQSVDLFHASVDVARSAEPKQRQNEQRGSETIKAAASNSTSNAETESAANAKAENFKETKSKVAADQKKWESSPVWQQRADWERHMIVAAFAALKNGDRELPTVVTAKFASARYTAELINLNHLQVDDNFFSVYKYKTYRDALAHECNLAPSKQQVFGSYKQNLEAEPRLKSSSSTAALLQQFRDSILASDNSKKTEQPSSTPTKSLQLPEDDYVLRAYVDKFYQKYASRVKQQQSDLKRLEDVDVQIALLALYDGYNAKDAWCMLLRSPKIQDFLRCSNPLESFSNYTKQRVAIAICEKQLDSDPQQRKRVEIVKPIIDEFCIGLADGKQIDGTDYTCKRNGDSRIMIAHDGRGEVLKLTGRWVEHCTLTDSDVRIFQKAELERQKKRLVRSHEPKPENKSFQMEL